MVAYRSAHTMKHIRACSYISTHGNSHAMNAYMHTYIHTYIHTVTFRPVMDLFELGGNSFAKDLLPNDELPEQPRKCPYAC